MSGWAANAQRWRVGELRNQLYPFVRRITLAFARNADPFVDRRLALASAILFGVIENRQGLHATHVGLCDLLPDW